MSDRDPIRARRARIARVVRYAQRGGYFALLLSIVSFVAAAVTRFPAALVDLSIGALVAACVILPVPIVVGYGVRAAEREERSGSSADRRSPRAEAERPGETGEPERSGSSADRRSPPAEAERPGEPERNGGERERGEERYG